MIPGSNILNMAMSVIATQAVDYYAYAYRTVNDIGLDVAGYQDPVTIYGSVQAVPRSVYQERGLDLQKNYVNFFVRSDAIDLHRDTSGDQFRYSGKVFQLISTTNWYGQDGWVEVLCVEIGNPPVPSV